MATVYRNNLKEYKDSKGFNAILLSESEHQGILSLNLPAGKFIVWLTAELTCTQHPFGQNDSYWSNAKLVSSENNTIVVEQGQRHTLSKDNRNIISGISLHSTYEAKEEHSLKFKFSSETDGGCWLFNIHLSALEVDSILDGKPNDFLIRSKLSWWQKLIRWITGK